MSVCRVFVIVIFRPPVDSSAPSTSAKLTPNRRLFMFEKEFRDRVHLCQQFDLKGRDFSFHYQAEINYFLNLWNLISQCNQSFLLRCHGIPFEVLISPQISCFFCPDYHAPPRLNNIGKCLVFSALSANTDNQYILPGTFS